MVRTSDAVVESRIWHAQNLALLAFVCGVFTITWDRVAAVDFGGFTLRLSQLAFSAAFLLAIISKKDVLRFGKHILLKGFALAMLLLIAYFALGIMRSHFPKKSALYTCWLLFNLGAIWGGIHLLKIGIAKNWIINAITAAMVFNSVVILIDQLAFLVGYKSGLIGFNQYAVEAGGISRPHAFSYEPSYIGLSLSLTLALLLPSLNRKRAGPWFLWLLGLFALIATTSRSGLGAITAISFIFFSMQAIRSKKVPWRPIAAALVLSGLGVGYFITVNSSEQLGRVVEILVKGPRNGSDGSAAARLLSASIANQISEETHWLGAGLGASFLYALKHKSFYEIERYSWDKSYQFDQKSYGYEVIHGTWPQLLAEGGIPAVLLYATALLAMLISLWRTWVGTGDPWVLAAFSSALVWFFGITFFIGNVARGDVWIWYAIWSFTALAARAKRSDLKLAAEANE